MTNKREIIITKALDLFSEKGLYFSLSEVTAAAGLQKQSIYNYFTSKDDLIDVMLNLEIEKYEAALLHKIEELNGEDKRNGLIGLMRFHIDYFLDEKKLKVRKWLNLLQEADINSKLKTKMTSIEKKYYSIVRTYFEDYFTNNQINMGSLDTSVMYYLVFIRGIIDGLLIFDKDSAYRANIEALVEHYCEKNL